MTRLLLDTGVLLDWAVEPKLLRDEARIAIADGRAQVFVSAASAWEIAIKRSLGKLKAPADLASLVKANRFTELPVKLRHAESAGNLPMRHGDPIDRLLIAQAKAENLTLVTRDEALRGYGAPTLAA
jgi:PIN domain nuclease of toxin-antitoxin system